MACAAALTIAVIGSLLVARSQSPASRQDAGRVQVIDGSTTSAPLVGTNTGEIASTMAPDIPVDDASRLVTLVTAHFPMIREGHVECDRSCKIILALGDQSRGPSPFNGALERYLSEQGYMLAGPLVIDQPGDNDTLLTLPLQSALPPAGALSTNRSDRPKTPKGIPVGDWIGMVGHGLHRRAFTRSDAAAARVRRRLCSGR